MMLRETVSELRERFGKTLGERHGCVGPTKTTVVQGRRLILCDDIAILLVGDDSLLLSPELPRPNRIFRPADQMCQVVHPT